MSNQIPEVFYTYLWLREDGTPYYVGKGSGIRAYRKHRVGTAPVMDRILVQEFPSEEDAFAAEIFLISYYGREDKGTGRLLNLTDGGENPPSPKGKKKSEATCLKLRARRHTAESRALMSAKAKERFSDKQNHPLFGKSRSPETIQKLSAAKIGNKNPRYGKPGLMGASKLVVAEVAEIKNLLQQGTAQSVLAKQFKVHQSTISNIAREKHWKDILCQIN